MLWSYGDRLLLGILAFADAPRPRGADPARRGRARRAPHRRVHPHRLSESAEHVITAAMIGVGLMVLIVVVIPQTWAPIGRTVRAVNTAAPLAVRPSPTKLEKSEDEVQDFPVHAARAVFGFLGVMLILGAATYASTGYIRWSARPGQRLPGLGQAGDRGAELGLGDGERQPQPVAMGTGQREPVRRRHGDPVPKGGVGEAGRDRRRELDPQRQAAVLGTGHRQEGSASASSATSSAAQGQLGVATIEGPGVAAVLSSRARAMAWLTVDDPRSWVALTRTSWAATGNGSRQCHS